MYQAHHVCAYYHILSHIKQIMFATTTMLFHVSSKLCTTISFLVSHKSCVSALPYPFLYQANHVCAYYHILSCIKQIMFASTTMLFHIPSKYVLSYHFLYHTNLAWVHCHILSCIKKIRFVHATISFHLSSKKYLQVI